MASTDTGFGKVKFWNDFNSLGVDETNDVNVGTENSGTQAISAAINGVYRLTTGAADGNRVAFSTALNYQASNGMLIGEARVTSVTALTTRAYFIGFTDVVPSGTLENPIEQSGTTLTTTASDAVGFMYDTDSTNDTWHCVAVKADADRDAYNTTNAPAAAGTYETLRVVVNIDGDADFWKDGKYMTTIENAITPGTDMCFIVMMETRTASALSLDTDYIYVEMPRN